MRSPTIEVLTQATLPLPRLPSRPLGIEAVVSVGVAVVAASLLAWLGPPGSDFAAHAYQRAVFLQHGFSLWNNFWYAGRYSFVTYSIIYYPLAALFGIRLLAVASVALAALAFAVVVAREWGPRGRWSSRVFAVVWPGIVLSAAFPFALGVAFALVALWGLQARARWRFGVFAALAFAASPLAFVLLAVIAVGIAAVKHVSPRALLVPAAVLASTGLVAAVLWRAFPDAGRYPFTAGDLANVLLFCGVGAVLTLGVPRARVLGAILLVYGLVCVAVFIVPSSLGSNIIRVQYLSVPIAVLVVSLRGWRPWPVCIALVAFAVGWNATPLVRSFEQDFGNPAASKAYWQPAIRYLHAHLSPSYRVEAVDTNGHWPAYYLAAARIPLTRGWFRQDDFPTNRVLYDRLTPSSYRSWLRALGVRYVVLGHVSPDYSSAREAALLRSGHVGLPVVLRTSGLTIYAVPSPAKILTGPAPARVDAVAQMRLVLHVARPGPYRLAVRYSPYWRPSVGCLARRRDGMTEVVAPSAGRIVLTFDVDPGRAIATLMGRSGRTCAAAA